MGTINKGGKITVVEYEDDTRQRIVVSGPGAESARDFLIYFATNESDVTKMKDGSFSFNAQSLYEAAEATDKLSVKLYVDGLYSAAGKSLTKPTGKSVMGFENRYVGAARS